MRKLVATFLIASLIAPSVVFAQDPPPFDSALAGSPYAEQQQAKIASLTAAGQAVGCQTGGFGGALAQTFGAILQQKAADFIQNKLGGAFSKLAQKAGPFGQVINAVGGMLTSKLSTLVQNQLGKLFGGAATGVVGQALGMVGAGFGAGVGAGAAAVPVNTVTADPILNKVDKQTKATQDATETAAQKDCVGDVQLNKLKNALLSGFSRSILDFANNGFDGEGAIIRNLVQFTKTGIEALMQDFVQNATAGICSKNKPDVQVMLLQQYQYEESYTVRSQCTDNSETKEGDSKSWYTNIFEPQNTGMGAYMEAESARRAQGAALEKQTELAYLAGDGLKPKGKCGENGGDPKGLYCEGGLQVYQATLTGAQVGHIVNEAATLPVKQVLNADEIGELVDALTAGLTQFIFQGLDGLAGASKKSSGGGASYLDQMVAEATGEAVDSTQNAVGGDIAAAYEVEQEYYRLIETGLAAVVAIRTGYQDAIACYQTKLATSQSQFAQERITNASTTIATILNPQITELTVLKKDAQDALAAYEELLDRVQAVTSHDDLLLIHSDYMLLLSTGSVHTNDDVTLLATNLEAARPALQLLSTDAAAYLSECRAL